MVSRSILLGTALVACALGGQACVQENKVCYMQGDTGLLGSGCCAGLACNRCEHMPPKTGVTTVCYCRRTQAPTEANRTLTAASGVALTMNCLNYAGGARLTVPAAPTTASSQELMLDTGSSTLAFCDKDLAEPVKGLKTDYLSCNAYGEPGNLEGYWGPFYKGAVNLGNDLVLDESYYSIMQQEVSMPCGSGLQGIFGVAFKQLNPGFYHPGSLQWPSGSVGSCPSPSADLVDPLMQYLKQNTPEGRLGIFWSGQVGSSEGMLYIGQTAITNSHYTQASVVQARLGETGYYDVNIEQFSLAGQSYAVSCGGRTPCLMDTGTPIMFVPAQVYDAMQSGQTGALSVQLAGATGSVTLEFDAATLMQNNRVAPYQEGEPYILGLPLWATYYTVFNVDGRSVEFVQRSSTELLALKKAKRSTVVV